MVGSFQRPFARSQHFAYLRIFHLVIIPQCEDRALYIRQAGNRFLQQGLASVAVEIRIGKEAVGDGQVGICTRKYRRPLMTQEIERLVDGYPVQPRGQSGFPLEGRQALPCLEKRVLQYIIGIVMCQDNAADLPVQRPAVLTDDYGKGFLPSSGTRQQAGHFSLIGRRHGLSETSSYCRAYRYTSTDSHLADHFAHFDDVASSGQTERITPVVSVNLHAHYTHPGHIVDREQFVLCAHHVQHIARDRHRDRLEILVDGLRLHTGLYGGSRS